MWGRWTSSQRIVSVAACSRASKWTLLRSHVQTYWNLLESRKEYYPSRSGYKLGTEVYKAMSLFTPFFSFLTKSRTDNEFWSRKLSSWGITWKLLEMELMKFHQKNRHLITLIQVGWVMCFILYKLHSKYV